jgi:hypothetical protein
MARSDPQALLSSATEATQRVCADVRNAQLTWVHFEAINGETEKERAQLHNGVSRLALGYL